MVIEETSTWLKKWVDDTVGDQLAILGPPQAGERRTKGRGVALYLLDIIPAAPRNGVRRRRLEADVRYLITAWAAEPLDAHDSRFVNIGLAAAGSPLTVHLDRQQ